jgi:hypothetical protein
VGWWGSEDSYKWTDVMTPRILLSYVPGVQADQFRGFWEVRGRRRLWRERRVLGRLLSGLDWDARSAELRTSAIGGHGGVLRCLEGAS